MLFVGGFPALWLNQMLEMNGGFSTESGCTLMTAFVVASWEIYQWLQVWFNDLHFLHDKIGIAYIGMDWWGNLGYSLVWIYLKRFNEGEYHARWAKLSHSGQLFWLLSQKSLFRNIGKKDQTEHDIRVYLRGESYRVEGLLHLGEGATPPRVNDCSVS